jgi:ribosomal protein S18 acetylase RimI-like enzyme
LENISFFIKKLSIKEIEEYLRLNNNDFFEALSGRVNIRDYSKKLYENAIHFTLYDRDKLVGFSPCYFNNRDIAYISSLTIRDGYRGLGLGSRIVRNIKNYAIKNSLSKIVVSVNCKNRISINFYKKNGFELANENPRMKICELKYEENL